MATFQTYDPNDESQRAAAKRFNIMVVGESGLGKTTCIQTLLNSLQTERVDLEWRSRRTVEITEVGSRFIDKEGLLPSYCHIFDSPGYGKINY
jgi:septin family protein